MAKVKNNKNKGILGFFRNLGNRQQVQAKINIQEQKVENINRQKQEVKSIDRQNTPEVELLSLLQNINTSERADLMKFANMQNINVQHTGRLDQALNFLLSEFKRILKEIEKNGEAVSNTELIMQQFVSTFYAKHNILLAPKDRVALSKLIFEELYGQDHQNISSKKIVQDVLKEFPKNKNKNDFRLIQSSTASFVVYYDASTKKKYILTDDPKNQAMAAITHNKGFEIIPVYNSTLQEQIATLNLNKIDPKQAETMVNNSANKLLALTKVYAETGRLNIKEMQNFPVLKHLVEAGTLEPKVSREDTSLNCSEILKRYKDTTQLSTVNSNRPKQQNLLTEPLKLKQIKINQKSPKTLKVVIPYRGEEFLDEEGKVKYSVRSSVKTFANLHQLPYYSYRNYDISLVPLLKDQDIKKILDNTKFSNSEKIDNLLALKNPEITEEYNCAALIGLHQGNYHVKNTLQAAIQDFQDTIKQDSTQKHLAFLTVPGHVVTLYFDPVHGPNVIDNGGLDSSSLKEEKALLESMGFSHIEVNQNQNEILEMDGILKNFPELSKDQGEGLVKYCGPTALAMGGLFLKEGKIDIAKIQKPEFSTLKYLKEALRFVYQKNEKLTIAHLSHETQPVQDTRRNRRNDIRF